MTSQQRSYPAPTNAQVMKQNAPHFKQMRNAGFLLITIIFFAQVLADFVYDEHIGSYLHFKKNCRNTYIIIMLFYDWLIKTNSFFVFIFLLKKMKKTYYAVCFVKLVQIIVCSISGILTCMNNTWATFSFQISCSLQNSTDFLNICKKNTRMFEFTKKLACVIVRLFISLEMMWVVTEEIHVKGLIGRVKTWGFLSFFFLEKTKTRDQLQFPKQSTSIIYLFNLCIIIKIPVYFRLRHQHRDVPTTKIS